MTLVDLHEKYGSAVRVGPNVVSIADPDAIDKIYGIKTDFMKVGGHQLANFTATHGMTCSAKRLVTL